MTTTVEAINTGNRTGDAFTLFVEGEKIATFGRGSKCNLTPYFGKNIKLESHHTPHDEFIGAVQVLLADPPRSDVSGI